MKKKYLCVDIIQQTKQYKEPFCIAYKKYESLKQLKHDLLLKFKCFDDVQFTEVYSFNVTQIN